MPRIASATKRLFNANIYTYSIDSTALVKGIVSPFQLPIPYEIFSLLYAVHCKDGSSHFAIYIMYVVKMATTTINAMQTHKEKIYEKA